MSDSISRQAAIRWVKTECNPYGKPTLDFESGKKVIEHLEQMPSADRPQGKWINGYLINGVGYKRCNQCFAEIEDTFFGESSFDVNFCPNCGARMTPYKGGDTE